MKENKPLASMPCHNCECVHQDEQHTPCFKWKTWFKESWRSIQKQAGMEENHDNRGED